MSHYFLVSVFIVQLVFLSRGHGLGDPVTGCLPTIGAFIQLSIFSHRYTTLAAE